MNSRSKKIGKVNLSTITLSILLSLSFVYENVGFAGGPELIVPPPPPPFPRIWASAEYLYWWEKNEPFNAPLLTTSPVGTSFATAGIIGQPGTEILYGKGSSHNSSVNFHGFNGVRGTVGGWFDNYYRFGAEGSIFGLETKKSTFNTSTAEHAILTIPYFNVTSQTERVLHISFPDYDTDDIAIKNKSSLWGADVNGLLGLYTGENFQLAALAGFRYLNLDESMDIFTHSLFFNANPPFVPFANSVFDTVDTFKTENQFYAFQLGARGSLIYRRFTLDASAKVAFGENEQTQKIDGQTVITSPSSAPITATGGILALTSNIGRFHRDEFAVATEEQVKLGYLITPNIHPYIGYNFLYINKVIRPGNEINRNINDNEIPPASPGGPAAPLPIFHNSSFWAQGITAGLEVRF